MLLKERVLMPVDVLRVFLLKLVPTLQSKEEKVLPVHGVALPDNLVSAALDGFNVSTQHRLDLVGAVTCDQRDLADILIRVDDVEQVDQLVILHRRSNLDTNRVLDAAEVLNMAALDLSCTIANPDEVC